jgi:hypothetical protein
LRRFVHLQVLSLYVLSHYRYLMSLFRHFVRIPCPCMFICPNTLSHIRCFVLICMFCHIKPYVFLEVLSVYVLSNCTFYCYSFCWYMFSLLDVLSLYVLLLDILSWYIPSLNCWQHQLNILYLVKDTTQCQ